MKAYELPAKVMPDGQLDIPPALTSILPRGEVIRLIVLISEPADVAEQADWSRLTAEQFLAGYSEADSIYDNLN